MGRVIASLFLVACAFAGDPEWPGFRGPSSNPVAINSNLPDKWSKTSNIEWTATLPGLGWSSPIVAGRNVFLTTVTTDGKAKQPQVGTNYSNEYVAELSKQGLKDKEVLDRLNARDFELPNEVTVHYFLYSIDLYSGKINWTRELHSGHPPGAVIARTASARRPPLPTATVFTSTSITSGSSPTISTATKSGTPRSKTFRRSSISARPLHPLLSMTSSSSSTTTRNSNSSRHSIRIPVSKSGAEIVLSTSKAPIARQAGRAPTSGKTPGVPKSSPLALASPSVTISRAKNCGALAGCPPCPSRVLSPTTAFCISTVGPLKPSPRSNLARPATSAHRTAPNSTISSYLPTELAYDGGLYVLTHNGILTRFDAKTGVQSYKARIDEGGDFTSSPWGYNG